MNEEKAVILAVSTLVDHLSFIVVMSLEAGRSGKECSRTTAFGKHDHRRNAVGGGDVGDYALIVLAIGFGSVAVDKAVACELSTAFDYLKKSLGSAPSGNLAIPEPDECKAGCPPCDPPVGTKCYVPNSGHPHPKALGWDPHYHIWNQGQDPETCTCHWRENHGSNGTYQFPPLGLYECDFYPSWPNN